MIDGPKLLVEWSSPWSEFRTSIRPALARSSAALAGEAPTGLFPMRGILVSWGAEAILLALVVILPTKLASLRPFRAPTLPKHEVIYYYGNELPQVEDYGGAQSGTSGKAGGQQAFHKTQTIRVARGNSVSNKVVDAPNVKLPVTTEPVANLLAFKPVPGPPPAEGLKASVTPSPLSKDAIVAPPPQVFRELNRSLAGLESRVVPPPSSASAERSRQIMGMSTSIIAPAPKEIPRDQSRSVMAMNSPIVQPAPDVAHDPPPLRGPVAATALVVPPPISAPQRESMQAAKLSMPAPAVIAPPPSQVTNDRTVSGASLADPKIVPPPVQMGGRSQDKHAITGITGADQIVPPPPSALGGSAIAGGGRGNSSKSGGFGTVLAAENVVPPPPSLASNGARGRGGDHGSLGGGLASSQVVPPPPSMGAAGDPLSGHGSGSKGKGFGGPLDAGSVLAPPSAAGGGGGNGIVVSNQPGSAMGVPGNATAGSLAMSPSGGSKPGLGGSGDGSGIGRGDGPGSGMTGAGPGAGKTGTGHGSDPNAHGGISPYPGPGGSGSGTNGRPPVPGASVSGGGTVTIASSLPSFGSDAGDATVPGRSSLPGGRRSFDVTVEGTSRSGGAFNFYGRLRGDKVYTKYISTMAGTVVMQFADASSAAKLYHEDLTSPEALVANLPVKLNRSRIVIACMLDRSGMLRDVQKVEADPGAPVVKVVAALATWKFTPAFRGNDPVEVNVLLGFNIDTR